MKPFDLLNTIPLTRTKTLEKTCKPNNRDLNRDWIKRRFHFHVATHVMCPWSFISLTSLNYFFKPIRTISVDTNCYLDLISTNYMCKCLHFVLMMLWYSGEWMASWFQETFSGNKSRAQKKKMMKWVFQTLAKDRDWKIKILFPHVVT